MSTRELDRLYVGMSNLIRVFLCVFETCSYVHAFVYVCICLNIHISDLFSQFHFIS